MKNKIFIILFLGSIVFSSPIMISKVLPASASVSDDFNTIEPVIIADNVTFNDNNNVKSEVVLKKEVKNKKNIDVDLDSKKEIKEEIKLKKHDEVETKNQESIKIETKDDSYFDDALFIGDSRTVGIEAFGGIKNATFFASTGMSVYNLPKTKVSIDGLGKVTLDELLAQKKFGKVYILLGINELGYELDRTVGKYSELIEKVKSTQEDVVVYIEANLHVTEKKAKTSERFSNERINQLNSMLESLANGEDIFYIDINEKFDDETGSLPSNFTQDGIHIYAKYYKDWTAWLAENTFEVIG